MLKRTSVAAHKLPRNMAMAPRFDRWNEKYEAWGLLRRMGKLAGTGFYIPPAWYQHFRMFPPVNNNFTEEKTQNPFNAEEPTQSMPDAPDPDRLRLRTELQRKSRSAASAGMRYMNLFWVQKPIDEMEREYYRMTRGEGVPHETALKAVLQRHHERLAVRNRASLIQAEQAKLSGDFISMREAMTVLGVLETVQSARMAPHEYAELATHTAAYAESAPLVEARVVERRVPKKRPEAVDPMAAEAQAAEAQAAAESSPATSAAGEPAADAEAKAAGEAKAGAAPKASPVLLEAEIEYDLFEELSTEAPERDSLPKLREAATDGSGEAGWYQGFSPTLRAPAGKRRP